MFDVQFTPSVFPGTEGKTDIIREAQTIRHINMVENDAHTRRIKQRGNTKVILPPAGYRDVWQGI